MATITHEVELRPVEVQTPHSALVATRCRPFTLLDAMILIGASAVGFTLTRSVLATGRLGGTWPVVSALPSLTTWTLATLALRFRSPRPELSRLLCQPGTLAGIMGVLLLATGGLLAAAIGSVKSVLRANGFVPGPHGWSNLGLLWLVGAGVAGALIAGTWVGLALSGRRRREPGWIDGLGRALGTLWVVHFGVLVGIALHFYV